MDDRFIRSEMLLGAAAMEKLNASKVVLFGVGGVGSFVAEALARSGVGHLVLVDHDTVARSNINRQIIALESTIGVHKAVLMQKRIADIHPQARVEAHTAFYLPGEEDYMEGCDYVVDAVDTLRAKVGLVLAAQRREIPIISAMGCGNKVDPARFVICDIMQTQVCPLCRAMRAALRREGICQLEVLYSPEKPCSRSRTPGSLPFVPSVAGLLMAAHVVKRLCGPFWPVFSE